MEFLHEPIFLLISIILLGELIGRIELFHFSLGSSAIIFVAVLFGSLGFTIPKDLQTLGLVLFIYSIGIQAGPGFLSSFKQNGLQLSLGAILVVFSGFIATLILSLVFGFNPATAAGLFAGSMTSTPGLAVAAEFTSGPEAGAAYGVTYTFGVIGVILFMRMIPLLSKVDIKAEEEREEEEIRKEKPPVQYIHLEVTNTNLFGHKIRDLDLERMGSVTITRLLRKGCHHPILVAGDTKIEKGDRLRIVGRESDLDRVLLYLGKKIKGNIDFNSTLEARRLIVSRTEAVGESAATLSIHEVYNCQVSRLTRNGMDLPAAAHTRFAMGDTLTVVGQTEALNNLAKLLGNDIGATYATRAISILPGLFIGFLLGKLSIPLPLLGSIEPGTSGGVLIAGLVLGHLKKTGPLIWEIPSTANAFIRELGLYFFLAAVGTGSGATIIETLKASGLQLLVAGFLVTSIPLFLVFYLGPKLFKISFLRLPGVLAGGMTSTPGLAAAGSISATRFAPSAYATVYPVALVGMILFTRILVSLLNGISI